MKTVIISISIILGLLFAGTVNAQDFDDIYKKYKKQDNITSLKINKLGCMFASLFASDDDGDEGAQFLKKTSNLRILINENGRNYALQNDIQRYISKSKLEPLMSIIDGDDNIEIYIQDKNKAIRQLLIVVSDNEDQVILHLNGKYPMKMIKEMMNDKTGSAIVKAAM